MRNPFAIKEDPQNPIPNEAFGWRVYWVAFAATWVRIHGLLKSISAGCADLCEASAMYGYDSAFIGGTLNLHSFQQAYGLTPTSVTSLSSNIVSTFQGGAFFGVILGTAFSEYFGRRWVICGSGVVFIAGAAIQLIGQLGALYGGRVLTGLGVGASSVLVPIYIGECSPAPIRGRLIGIFEIMLQIALVFGFWVNYGVNLNISSSTDKQWHIPVAVQLVPSGLLVISMFWTIESPRWLISKGHKEQALKALSWVRNLPADHEYVQREMAEMSAAVDHEIELTGGKTMTLATLKELKNSSIRNRILICVALMLLQNLTGINAINYYSPTIFKSIGFTGTSTGLLATGVYGLVKMFTTVVFMLFIVDRFGRRFPLLVGALGAGFAMFYMGAYAKISGSFDRLPPADAGANAAVAMIYLYAIFYGFSWNGIPWIFAAEVLPTRVRGLGMMCAVCMQWLAQFMIVYSLPYMVKSIKYGMFFFFAACTCVAFLFAYFFVPETKGVTLEDMDLLYGPHAPTFARAKRRAYDDAHRSGLTSNRLYAMENEKNGMEDELEERVETV
ncbi:related to monosaccharide transporter [Phialocephala subalpina]|uniref:Quinate transporter n=1 Tax=Phialocephala subalpina TaxID=576137 RepID=A0A1L7XH79_9HELO|nr:related to monosaccharide transporter [Phialocephala subalpina]